MTRSAFAIAVAFMLCLAAGPQALAASHGSAPAKTNDNKVREETAAKCTTARHQIQNLVCKDADLAALDKKLAGIFAIALEKVEAMPNSAPQVRHLKAYELRWWRERNECVKSRDPRACTIDSYHRRIAELQARFLLVKSRPPVVYVCRNNPRNQLVATFVDSEPSSVRLTHRDAVTVAVQAISGSGARYLGERGVVFWIKGDNAMVTWPKGNQFDCTVRK